jgi:hypothetical protein
MFGKLLNRILVPENLEPEIVCWSPEMPDPSLGTPNQREELTFRKIVHGGIVLAATCPAFGEAGTDDPQTGIHLEVTNKSGKALGFAARGIVLVLNYDGETVPLACKRLTTLGATDDVMVESGQEVWMNAYFDPAPLPASIEVVIQANRILARPYFFRIPYDLGPENWADGEYPGRNASQERAWLDQRRRG